jgi:DNA-binding NarL/FixJ family response regulator
MTVTATRTRLLLVDDHPMFRRGLAAVLRNEPELEVSAEAGDADAARRSMLSHTFDLAVVDMLMPGISGITLTQELRELQPHCRVIGLSAVEEPGLIADMLRAGASGFVLKTQPVPEIVEAIRRVGGGTRYLPPSIDAGAIEAHTRTTGRPVSRLTPREREVFELLIRGYSSPAIAERLQIALRTVETHRQRITRKLSTRSIVELQRIAALYGGLS